MDGTHYVKTWAWDEKKKEYFPHSTELLNKEDAQKIFDVTPPSIDKPLVTLFEQTENEDAVINRKEFS